jgi:hypothetical protein
MFVQYMNNNLYFIVNIVGFILFAYILYKILIFLEIPTDYVFEYFYFFIFLIVLYLFLPKNIVYWK